MDGSARQKWQEREKNKSPYSRREDSEVSVHEDTSDCQGNDTPSERTELGSRKTPTSLPPAQYYTREREPEQPREPEQDQADVNQRHNDKNDPAV